MIKEFLDRNGYQLDIDDVNIELNSHPDFPSFKAYTDTLNNLEIENLAVTIPKEQFKKLTDPVLVSLNSNGKSEIALAQITDNDEIKLNLGDKEAKQIILPYQKFLSVWDGSLIAIERNTKKDKFRPNVALLLLGVLLLTSVVGSIRDSFEIVNLLFALLSVIGLVISYYIIQTTINPNSITSKFCSIVKTTDCNGVINSSASKVFGKLQLSDLALIYFFGIIFRSADSNTHIHTFMGINISTARRGLFTISTSCQTKKMVHHMSCCQFGTAPSIFAGGPSGRVYT